jgi:hypothetical protein
MNTNEFYRIPVSALKNIGSGDASSFAVMAAQKLGRTMNPVVVTLKGMNQETFEMEYTIEHNNVMAQVAKAAGLEFVDAFLVKAADVEMAKQLF